MKRLSMTIHGRVQGVFYRASTEQEARRLGLTGWVRNRRDGTVEVLAEGPEADLRALLTWCRGGPPLARVTKIDERWSEATGEHTAFQTSYSR